MLKTKGVPGVWLTVRCEVRYEMRKGKVYRYRARTGSSDALKEAVPEVDMHMFGWII